MIEEICRERGVRLRQLGREIRYEYQPGLVTEAGEIWPVARVVTDQFIWPPMRLKLLGEHQAANAALVVAAVEELRSSGPEIPQEAVARGLAEVHWPARLEILQRRPLVILDCAHNVASAEMLRDTLRQSFPLGEGNGAAADCKPLRPPQRFLVFAGSSDKDLEGMLRVLAPVFQRIFLTRYGHNPRCVPPEELAQMLQRVSSVPFEVCPTAPRAWEQARAAAASQDQICITGSVFLAGELRPLMLASAATSASRED